MNDYAAPDMARFLRLRAWYAGIAILLLDGACWTLLGILIGYLIWA